MSVLVSLAAGIVDLAPSEGAEHVMLCLDDEMAGLIEAADVPVGQDKSHSPQPGAQLPAEVPSAQSKSAAVYSAQVLCCCPVLCHAVPLCCIVLTLQRLRRCVGCQHDKACLPGPAILKRLCNDFPLDPLVVHKRCQVKLPLTTSCCSTSRLHCL